MEVIIRNKLFSLRGSSSVKNEQGEDVFFVKGKLFSPTHVKWVCDTRGTNYIKCATSGLTSSVIKLMFTKKKQKSQ